MSFSQKSVSKLSILRPFVVHFRRAIKLVILPLWPSLSFLLLKSKRTKFILEITTAKKAMFIIERCLSVGARHRQLPEGGRGVLPYIFLKAMCRPKRYAFLTVLVLIRVW